ncbi:MAG: hypothetical protein FWE67_10070 [Planctomycetaceae bacterium]|nr:hypothetical protein [Planctomycetaceae bacterium]
MKPVEQIHLIVRTASGSRTVEIAARSGTVSFCDVEEIAAWFSEDKAKNQIQTRRTSLFFHPLPSGCFAFGRIINGTQKRPALMPHIFMKGTFQVLVSIIPPETLLFYGNNPFLLEEKWQHERAEGLRPPVVFPKNIELFDNVSVKNICASFGAYKTAEIIQNVSDNVSLLLTLPKTIPPLAFLKALFSLLPLRFRTELSFSTETHISESHIFRLILVNENKRRVEELSALSGIPHKVITDETNPKIPVRSFDPYSQFIFQVIHGNSFDFLKQKLNEEYRYALAEQDCEVNTISDWSVLHALAVQYLEEMNGGKTDSERQLTSHDDTESVKLLSRSTASAEHIIALLKLESKHLTDLLTTIRKAK